LAENGDEDDDEEEDKQVGGSDIYNSFIATKISLREPLMAS
jgi:hypothetical protein